MTNTIAVVIAVSRRDGQVTFWVSLRTSCINLNRFVLAILCPVGCPVTKRDGQRIATPRGLKTSGFTPNRRRLESGCRNPLAPKAARIWQEWRDSNPQPPVL